MRNFFIDLENVRSYGLEGILLLKPDDKVYVFYSDNANTLTIPTIESLNESSASVKYIKTNYIGANAMDFQIVTLLGASIEKEQKGSFYIISHDNEFKSAVKFCEGYFTGYDIVTGVFANILLAINSEKGQPSEKKEQARNDREKRNNKADNKAKTGNAGVKENENAPAAEKESAKTKAKEKTGNVTPKRPKANRPEKEAEKVKKQADPEIVNAETKVEENVKDNESEKESVKTGRKRRRSRGRDKTKSVAAETPVVENEPPVTEKKKPVKEPVKKEIAKKGTAEVSGNYKYVYNNLSDFLSKKTIDMYVLKIDEGIRTCSNVKELHEFFKKSYGKDEAEALYKIICADFDKMKKEAAKG